MKRILTLIILALSIIALFITFYFKNRTIKGGDTKIAYWNFNSSIMGDKRFSLADTMANNTHKDFIAPRM